MTIKTRITLIGIMAVGGLVFLLLGMMTTEFSRYRQQHLVVEELALISELSALVHELQKERGLSTGFLAAPEAGYRDSLLLQQAATDRKLNALRRAEGGLEARLQQELTTLRQRIMAGNGVYPEDYRQYSLLIQSLLDQVWSQIRQVDFAGLKDDLGAHSHLMFAKEYLGRVRATVNHCLRTAGVSREEKVAEAARLHGLFAEYRRLFQLDAGADWAERLDQVLGTPAAEEVFAVMQATAAGEFAPLQISSEQWFNQATRVINDLKKLEDRSLARLVNEGEQLLDNLRRRLLFFTLGTLGVGGGILLLVLYTLHGMIRSLDLLLAEIGQIGSQQDFGRRLPVRARDEMGTIASSFNRLLTIVERLLQEKDHLAGTDQLTGLNNRRRFKEFLDQELTRHRRVPEPLSLIIFDIDHFKLVNDTHGHETGDLVLREMAQLLRATIRRTDTPARWGGEEFLVLLPATTVEAAAGLAEKLRQAIAGHDFPNVGRLTASFGVAALLDGEHEESDLLRRVDQALYQAKQQGRNRVVSWSGA